MKTDEEIKEIMNDPKKLLDLFRVFHRMIHLMEAKEMMSSAKNKTNESMGLSDSCEAKVIKANSTKIQEGKK